jgi:hypothetical protein
MSKRAARGDANPAPVKKADQRSDDDDDAPLVASAQQDGPPTCKEHGIDPELCVWCLRVAVVARYKDLEAAQIAAKDADKKLNIARRRNRSAWRSNIMCDGCRKSNRSGTRYICTECDDTDFCQECVDGDVHLEHALVQVKYDHQHVGRRREVSYGSGGGHYGMRLQ